MPVEVTINQQDIKYFADKIQQLTLELPINEIANLLLAAIQDNFESNGAYFQRGMEWSPLKPATIRDRLRHGYDSNSILRREASHGGLMGRFIANVTNNSVIVSNNTSYAPYLHYGTKFMPSRLLFPDINNIGFPNELLNDIMLVISNHISIL